GSYVDIVRFMYVRWKVVDDFGVTPNGFQRLTEHFEMLRQRVIGWECLLSLGLNAGRHLCDFDIASRFQVFVNFLDKVRIRFCATENLTAVDKVEVVCGKGPVEIKIVH